MARILVVDDSQTSLQLLDVLLFREGFEPLNCNGPENAVSLALRHQVDAAIFDLVAFQPTGLELLRKFREQPQLKYLPVILVLASPTPQERAQALAAGANEVLTRPFDPQELFFRLRRLLQTIPATSQGILQGDMARFFVGDVLQQLLAAGAEGVVEIVLPEVSVQAPGSSVAAMAVELSGAREGELHLKDGKIWRAQLGRWQGEPAVFAILRVKEGTFRFLERLVHTEGQKPLTLQEILLNLAWLEDEIAAKQHLLPERDTPLFPGKETLEGETKFPQTPVVFELLRRKPGQSLWELWKHAPYCPIEINTAVIELLERGAVIRQDSAARELKRQLSAVTPSSQVSTTSMTAWLHAFMYRLARHAVRLGANPAAMHLAVVWPTRFWDGFLNEVVATIPRGVLGVPKEEVLRDLAHQGSGSLRFATADGAVLVHLFRCSGLAAVQARATAGLAMGILVGWAKSEEAELLPVLSALPQERTLLACAHKHCGEEEQPPPSFPFLPTYPKSFPELLDLFFSEDQPKRTA